MTYSEAKDYYRMKAKLKQLSKELTGDLFWDTTMRSIYATDASAYREMPLAVAIPKSKEDIRKLIAFANAHKTSLIPRTAGTSLAGQVVGAGIIVDVSKHFTEILEFNEKDKWVRVQPGVIRDELNMFLKNALIHALEKLKMMILAFFRAPCSEVSLRESISSKSCSKNIPRSA